jgi:hypothetical protein
MVKYLIVTRLLPAAVTVISLLAARAVAQGEPPTPAHEDDVQPRPEYKPPPRGARVGGSAAHPAGQ